MLAFQNGSGEVGIAVRAEFDPPDSGELDFAAAGHADKRGTAGGGEIGEGADLVGDGGGLASRVDHEGKGAGTLDHHGHGEAVVAFFFQSDDFGLRADLPGCGCGRGRRRFGSGTGSTGERNGGKGDSRGHPVCLPSGGPSEGPVR